MIGPLQQSERKLFHYGINLEKRVRSTNPLRQIKQAVDFSFVRDRVAGFYGTDGHQSEDPIVVMKLMLLLFLDDVRSERELMKIVSERLDYLWFLEFDIDEEIPNHSVLSKARKRWGGEVFEELFVGTIQQCVEAGLVEGHKIHMDGSLVQANASMDSLRRGAPVLIEALRRLYRDQAEKLDEPDPEGGTRATVSRTDPDAAVARKNSADRPALRYKHHRAIDDLYGVITAVETTPGNVVENHKLGGLIDQHEENTGQRVEVVVADAQYGTNENFATCQKRKIRSHMKDMRSTQRNDAAKAGIFKQDDFKYDEGTETYICPAGERLTKTGSIDRGFYIFRSDARLCQQCRLKKQCMKSRKHVRTLKRHIDHADIERARLESQSGWAKSDRRRRKHRMEGSFADAANRHGFKRARWRRLHNQKIQDWLIASCQNIRIFLFHRSPKHAGAVAVRQSHVPVQLATWIPRSAHTVPIATQTPTLACYPTSGHAEPY
jgi:transposase